MNARQMLIAIAAAAMLVTGSAAVQAQGKGKGEIRGKGAEVRRGDDERGELRGGPRGRGMRAERSFLHGIELTEAQRVQVRDIHLKYRPRHQAFADTVRANARAGIRPAADSAMRVRMQQVTLQERAEIRAVLTAEQQKQFDANLAKWSEKRKVRADRMKKSRG